MAYGALWLVLLCGATITHASKSEGNSPGNSTFLTPPTTGDAAWKEYDASFAQLVPPIFRVLLMMSLGIAGFGIDLTLLQRWGLNLWSMPISARLPVHSSTAISRDAVRESGGLSLFMLAGAHAAWALTCWMLYYSSVDPINANRTLIAQVWEVIALFGLMAFWLIPNPFRHIQHIVLRIQFSDVIFADVLTSFAKVLGDVWLSFVLVMYSAYGIPATEKTLWTQQSNLAVPFLISVPYLVRFRQCVSEYRTSSPLGRDTRSTRPLYNALKYASAFPVIWLSASRSKAHDTPHPKNAVYASWLARFPAPIQSLWLLSVLFNTLFSFWWDVTNDWGLDLFLPSSFSSLGTPHLPVLHRRSERRTHILSPDHDEPMELASRPSHGRRGSILRVPEKPLPLPSSVYYLFIFIDLLLRFTWSLKLSSHLQYLVQWQRGLLLLEALEIVRRSVWILLRVEWELVKRESL
ncbi:protein-ER retention protein [Malassezia yamatoensis]|uniref:Protein-ER retention protein n=1 Tax=Malassezia yamatoensis TaxID=253288 RepID=A0AAJ6CHB8_9BASI|nr:protein-ER retention protein [Malassezia yamatoensis]